MTDSLTQMTQQVRAAAESLRAKFANDPHRPRYHFLPPCYWMNDPNGLIHWNGEYHIFYQHNPNGAFWGTMHWGHAKSKDLVHWEHLPIALAPTPNSVDQDGIFSGCMVNDNGVPTIIYTGIRGDRQTGRTELPCLATGSPDLLTWTKHAGNPVIAAPPNGTIPNGFRDHAVWKEGATWYQLIGSGLEGVGGTTQLYRSADLRQWEYVGPLCIGDPKTTGEMWECPDFFPLGQRHILMESPIPNRTVFYFVGAYNNHVFTWERQSRPDWNLPFYAPQSFTDAQGRRIMFGWLRESRSIEAHKAAGWAGVMTLPRVLTLLPNGMLGQQPAPEVEMLRGQHARWTNISATNNVLREVRGRQLEIRAEIELGTANEIRLSVLRSPDGAEQARIVYDRMTQRLNMDLTRASLNPDGQREIVGGPLPLEVNETLRLRLFVDGSVIELFANDHFCLTSRVYPTLKESVGLELSASHSSALVKSLDVWELKSIW